jgi:2'-hydroxyisoflavone reductase
VRLLVLGGTVFLGRAAVEQALRRGHEVTLFNRGESNPDLFPEAEQVRGDREHDLAALESRRWDAVLDTSGYLPRVVGASAQALRASGQYVFVSSISVYADFSRGRREGDALAQLGDVSAETVDDASYGALKGLCEQAVEAVFGGRALIVRPGLIVGPHDPTGRFTYWARRLQRDGTVLAPGPGERPFQFVDVRDLAAWLVESIEQRRSGVFNATNEGVPLQELLAGADVTWVTDEFLEEQGVGHWLELPFWLPEREAPGIHRTDVGRALAAGLHFRPLAETLRGAATARAADGVGLSPKREAELLAAWRERS